MDTAAPISAEPHPAAPQPASSQSVTPEPEPLRRCRSIGPHGRQCPDPALRDGFFCYTHRRDRTRASALCAAPAIIEVPLLDSHAAIQSVATEVARALAAGTIDAAAVRGYQSMLAIALRTLPRPTSRAASSAKAGAAAEAPKSGGAPSPTAGSRSSATRSAVPGSGRASSTPAETTNDAPLTEIVITPEGEELAPDIPYHAPEAKKERVWSFAEYLYRTAHPERAHEPLPEEGYIDPEKGSSIPDPNAAQPAAPASAEAVSGNAISRNPVSEDTASTTSHHTPPQPEAASPTHQPIAGILPELQAVAFAFRRSCREGSQQAHLSASDGSCQASVRNEVSDQASKIGTTYEINDLARGQHTCHTKAEKRII